MKEIIIRKFTLVIKSYLGGFLIAILLIGVSGSLSACGSPEEQPEEVSFSETTMVPTQPLSSEETEYSYGEGYEKQEVEAFAQKIQEELSSDNKEGFANLISYPIDVEIDGEKTTMNDALQFAENYDKIISPEFKGAVLSASASDMFSNYMGIMMGDGEIWFTSVYEKEGLWIIAINN